jgi:hypothetical protein
VELLSQQQQRQQQQQQQQYWHHEVQRPLKNQRQKFGALEENTSPFKIRGTFLSPLFLSFFFHFLCFFFRFISIQIILFSFFGLID